MKKNVSNRLKKYKNVTNVPIPAEKKWALEGLKFLIVNFIRLNFIIMYISCTVPSQGRLKILYNQILAKCANKEKQVHLKKHLKYTQNLLNFYTKKR